MAGTFLSVSVPAVSEVGSDVNFDIRCYSNNALTTPATIALSYRDPASVKTTLATTPGTAGVATASLNMAPLPGPYQWTVATTTPDLTESGSFWVLPQRSP